jgi:hypothetical protein
MKINKLLSELQRMIMATPEGVTGCVYFSLPKKYEIYKEDLLNVFPLYVFEFFNDDLIGENFYLGFHSFMYEDTSDSSI